MRKLAIVVALSSTVLATPALARDGAWYIGGELGPMIVEDIEFDRGTTDNIVSVDHEYGVDGSVFAGYDFGGFRVEAEAAYKRAEVDSLQSTVRLPGQGTRDSLFVNNAEGRTTALSFMLNGMLDFGDDEGTSGFVGGGAGVARVKLNNFGAFSNRPAIDDSDTRFAWQVIAGVRQAVTDNIDVQLKYRFFNVDDLRMGGFGGPTDFETRLRTHSLMGGIVFNFGAAPPPPPAAVPIGPFIVFFDWDRSDITPQAAAILDNAAAAYQQTGQAQVVLAGHADRSGSAQYNVGLSQRRADSVRSYLAGRGIPDGSIATEAFGESRPLVETADGVREPQNRRVEITFGPGAGL
jgi:outer membrane protein OmpA-like peptidoglycan-associated protein